MTVTNFVAALACLLAVPIVAAAPLAPAAEHPLTGRIWDTRTQQFIARSELEERLRRSSLILLGEVHDNADHHRLRRELLAALVRDGRRPAIAMEQFDREHQRALDLARVDPVHDAERLKTAGKFNDKSWNWSYYQPIVQIAIAHDLPLLAANLSRADAFKVAKEGFTGVFSATTMRLLKLDRPLPDAAQRGLERAIIEGHCGKAPPGLLPGLVAAQRARDAVMAATIAPQTTGGVVLIAGNGHVRGDFGVPVYLAQYPEARMMVTVALLETQQDQPAPADYYAGATPEYDFILFTPHKPRPDPCEGIRFTPR